MPKTLYVGRLSKRTRASDLKDELTKWKVDKVDMRTGHAYVVITNFPKNPNQPPFGLTPIFLRATRDRYKPMMIKFCNSDLGPLSGPTLISFRILTVYRKKQN
jgi:hypothetical protein